MTPLNESKFALWNSACDIARNASAFTQKHADTAKAGKFALNTVSKGAGKLALSLSLSR